MNPSTNPVRQPGESTPDPDPLPLEPGDFYMEDGYLVFTAQYHLKRGTCCGSQCRHCPY
jgi:hypothetical protein